ncbi:MAG TPA: molybdopterin-binding protein [Nitrolancea sp.]|nr:molybdopterin-binding protein [Nitrolancea sp.]
MQAVVVSIGSELTEGFITDTNATFLAQQMSALGIELVGVSQVADVLENIVRVLQRGWDDADLIVTTGGIGPTDDDLTREAVAALLHEEVHVDQELLSSISSFFRSRSIPMPEKNTKQAWLIPSAEALDNPMGTAPGWFVRHDGKFIASMPGVPREMRRMWAEQVVPRLLDRLGDRVYVSKTLKTIGIGESAAEREIAEIIHRGDPIVATYAKDDGVHIRIVAASPDRSVAESAVSRTEAEVRAILGDYVYGVEPATLGSAVLAPLVLTGDTLAISEAGSGGRITSLIAEEPASVVHFSGGIVRAFSYAASINGIDATDPAAASALARTEASSIRGMLKADYGLSVVVRLTPGEHLDLTKGDIALCLNGRTADVAREHTVTAIPSEIRRRAAMWAAEFLRSSLLEDHSTRG